MCSYYRNSGEAGNAARQVGVVVLVWTVERLKMDPVLVGMVVQAARQVGVLVLVWTVERLEMIPLLVRAVGTLEMVSL